MIDGIISKSFYMERELADALVNNIGLKFRTSKLVKFNFNEVDFEVNFETGQVFKDGREVKGRSKGYTYVTVKDDVCTAMIGIHRLVLITYNPEAFLARLGNEKEVVACHKDNDTYNNRLENLEWGTQDLNHFHGWLVTKLAIYYPDAVRVVKRKKRGSIEEDALVLREGIENAIIKVLMEEHRRWIKEGLKDKEQEFFEFCIRTIAELKNK